MSKKYKPLKKVYQDYNAKRVQVAQIKSIEESDEHKQLLAAIEKLKRKWKCESNREVLVRALLDAAK